MGYTHYWRAGADTQEWAAAYPDIQLDAVKICKAAKERGIALGDGLGQGGRPVIGEGVLTLNGADPEDYETFQLLPTLQSFDFCKTAQRPYDLVVCAILLRAFKHAPAGIEVASDGEWDDEWKPARALVEELFGVASEQPWRP